MCFTFLGPIWSLLFAISSLFVCIECEPVGFTWDYTIELRHSLQLGIPLNRSVRHVSEHHSTATDTDKLDPLSQPVEVNPLVWNSSMCSNDSGRPPSTFLWQISTKPPSYLFGTLHVAYTHVWPTVAPIVKEMFTQADQVYFELDLTNPQTLDELRQCQLLPLDTQLTDVLPVKLVARLQRYLTRFQRLLDQWIQPDRLGFTHILYETMTRDWQRKRPIWLLLLVNSLNRGELTDRGVPVLDLYLAQEAGRMGKVRGAVEQVADQCNPLNKVKAEQVAMALELTLDSLESASRPAEQTQSGKRSKPVKPQVARPESASWTSPVSNRENLVIPGELGAETQTRGQLYPFPVGNSQNGQTEPQRRHAEWFMHPVQQLVQQYNCGDLTAVLHGVPMSPVASVTASESAVKQPRAEQQSAHNQYTDALGFTKSSLTNRKLSYSKNITNTLTETRHNLSDSALLLDLESYLNSELIVKRNARMAKKIVEKLQLAEKQNESAFFALGAAHFLGERDTVIDHLVQAGYHVKPIPRNFTQDRPPKEPQAKVWRKFTGKYISRNRRKQDDDKELLSEYDVPKFRPRYVKFENHWIRIEDFNPNTYPNRLQRPPAQSTKSNVHGSNERGSKVIVLPSIERAVQSSTTQKLSNNISKSVAVNASIAMSLPLMISVLFITYFPIILYDT